MLSSVLKINFESRIEFCLPFASIEIFFVLKERERKTAGQQEVYLLRGRAYVVISAANFRIIQTKKATATSIPFYDCSARRRAKITSSRKNKEKLYFHELPSLGYESNEENRNIYVE